MILNVFRVRGWGNSTLCLNAQILPVDDINNKLISTTEKCLLCKVLFFNNEDI